jgi:hypothetical protein
VTPEEQLAALEGVPVTLLPVRLETRFAGPTTLDTELRIRVYPDQIQLDAHVAELTDGEIASGQTYWRSRWQAGVGAAELASRAWAQLTRGIRPARAAFIVRALQPSNAPGDPAGPKFPAVARRDPGLDLPMVVRALPSRWVAVGFDAAGTRILQRWFDNPIPEGLLATATLTAGPDLTGDAAVDAYLGWASDYKQAVTAGMGQTIKSADLPAGRLVADGFERLIVLGVGATTAAEGAARFDRLLSAHAANDGLGYLAPGTPTNNFADDTAAGGGVAVADPAAPVPARDPQWSAGARVVAALGLPAQSSVAALPGAEAKLAQVSAAVVDATWAASLGYFVDHLLWPLVSPDDSEALRDHATRFLQPIAPLGTLRVGRQPLGLLPVLAPGGRGTEDPFAARLGALLAKLRPIWDTASARVPTLARMPGGQPLERALLTILQRSPWTTRVWYRRVLGPLVGLATGGLGGAQSLQAVLRNIGFLDGLGVQAQPRLVPFTLHDRRGHLSVPFVNRGELKEIADATTRPAGRAELGDAGDARSLLGALARFAALQELDLAGARLARRFLPPLEDGAIAWRTPEVSGIGTITGPSPGTLANTPLPDLGGRTPAQEVAERQRSAPGHASLADLKAFQDALKTLAAADPADVELALRAHLGVCSHRLDAWLTSLASRQLASVRAARPAGTHVGGYGCVERLRPETAPDSLGYVVAPSIAHAATAGVLRSGYLAHAMAAVDDAHRTDILDVDVSSPRTQTALELMRAVRAGVPLGVVLGYRLERALREAGLSVLILPLRRCFPQKRSPIDPHVRGLPIEATPPGEVVQGAELLEVWRGGQAVVLEAMRRATGRDINDPLFPRLVEQIDRLADTYDSIADVALAESVHQIVRGQPERAQAAMRFLDRQEVPVEPDVTATPRSATAFVQRVVVAIGPPDLPGAWRPASANDPRFKAEPRVGLWIAQLLGSPATWSFSGRATPEGGAPVTAAVTLAELSLSPLAAVLAATSGSGDKPSELEERIARALAPKLPTAARVELLADTPGARGLAQFAALSGAIARVLRGARPADASVFDLPDVAPAAGFDAADLKRRADAAASELRAATTALDAAAPATLEGALDRASRAGLPGAVPRLGLAGDELLDFARDVAALAHGRVQALDALGPVPATDPAAYHLRRLAAVFGSDFPALGVFTPPAGSAAAQSLAAARQSALLGGDPMAPVTWITRLARVRPAVDALWHLLTAAEVTTAYPAARFAVAQLPNLDGERWAALPFDPAAPRPAPRAAVLLHTSGTVTLAGPVAALAIDSWTEQIPLPVETAGVTLHYDAPSNRAPQTALLAVPHDLSERPWGLDALVGSVADALDLAHLRGVTLAELPVAAAVLPALYAPFDASGNVPSFDVDRMAKRMASTFVLGKD